MLSRRISCSLHFEFPEHRGLAPPDWSCTSPVLSGPRGNIEHTELQDILYEPNMVLLLCTKVQDTRMREVLGRAGLLFRLSLQQIADESGLQRCRHSCGER